MRQVPISNFKVPLSPNFSVKNEETPFSHTFICGKSRGGNCTGISAANVHLKIIWLSPLLRYISLVYWFQPFSKDDKRQRLLGNVWMFMLLWSIIDIATNFGRENGTMFIFMYISSVVMCLQITSSHFWYLDA